MVKIVDTLSILYNGEQTFISINGYGILDQCPIHGPNDSHYNHNLATDDMLNSSLEHQVEDICQFRLILLCSLKK